MERLRRGILWVALVTEVLGGVLGFLFGAEAIFADIGSDPLARLCLRLAAYCHASMAAVLALFLLKTREARWLRWFAGAALLYHLPAGIDAWSAITGGEVRLTDPVYGPVAFHGTMSLLLLVAVSPTR